MSLIKKELVTGLILVVILGGLTAKYALSYSRPSRQADVLHNVSSPSGTLNQPKLLLNLEEIAKHNQPADCWIIINSRVLSVSPFLRIHPGGEEEILPYCGRDATAAFDRVGHSNQAVAMLADFLVGMMGESIDSNQSLTSPQPLKPTRLPLNKDDDSREREFDDD